MVVPTGAPASLTPAWLTPNTKPHGDTNALPSGSPLHNVITNLLRRHPKRTDLATIMTQCGIPLINTI